jgi:lipopolysaccharide transport system ATP-binding protein
MYLRLAFAVAAHLELEILLVDEVLAVGDAAFQKKCLKRMRDVTQEGRTVLFVSHNLAAISEITQQSIWIDAGKLVMYENTKDVVSSYLQKTLYGAIDSGYRDLYSENGMVDTPRKVRATWVRLVNDDGEQTTIFTEEKPISIEIGISVQSPVTSIQMGCGIVRVDRNIELFTVPSKEIKSNFLPGEYVTKLKIDPNYLREGLYSINIKIFADDIRQDVVREVIRFSLTRDVTTTASAAAYQRWVNGPLYFDYEWDMLKKQP